MKMKVDYSVVSVVQARVWLKVFYKAQYNARPVSTWKIPPEEATCYEGAVAVGQLVSQNRLLTFQKCALMVLCTIGQRIILAR
jgi:hypothetical protein